MTFQIYNSLTNKLEVFKPVKEGRVRMYNCGPTVYGYASIGNFRTFVVCDLLRRFLEYKGYGVTQVMNITDVGHLTDDGDDGEDKLEVTAKKEKKHPLEIAKYYTEAFMKDWRTLNMKEPEFRPKATETVGEMIAMVKVLLEKGYAYEAGGNVYFDITSFKDYGKLSGNYLEKLTKSRVESDPNKRNPHDFVLWFGNSKYKNHILKWDSPWGEGYPGWHMECSAMSAKYLSEAFDNSAFHPEKFETIDIHTGGEDNKFPHHECEIAQTEGATGKKYVNYWLHPSFLISEGQKMSKSLGNVYHIFELVKEGFSPRAIRYLLLSTHYRIKLNFTKEGLKASEKALERIDTTLQKLDGIRAGIEYNEPLGLAVNEMLLAVENELDNDLNISGALGAVFETLKTINKAIDEEKVGKHQAQEIIKKFFEMDRVFGLLDKSIFEKEELPPEIATLLEERSQARENKDFETSDRIRDELKEKGYLVKDTKEGQQVEKL
ncbi:MAG: cysteine--tRNA ligase [Candidatus Woesearchaeota archaeon]